MSSRSSEESQTSDRLFTQISLRIADGRVDPANMFALTGQLMEIAQAERQLIGAQKKQAVVDAFARVTDTKPKAKTFMEEVLPLLIDTIKMAARGGLQLVIETRCCGLVRA